MTLNVTGQHYKTGLDTSVLKEVSQEILRRAAEKNNQSNTQKVNSLFQKADLGLDLYNGKVDAQTARQIALNNSAIGVQLDSKTLASIAFLNSQAAQAVAANKVQKNVDGKITVAVNETTAETKIKEAPKFNSIVSFATNKDKNGSNPFYHGELLMGNSKKEEKSEEKANNNIFAA